MMMNWQLIKNCCAEADEKVEPQPLWEYPSQALAEPVTLCEINLSALESVSVEKSVRLTRRGSLSGVAVWADWSYNGKTLSTGLTKVNSTVESLRQ